MRAELPSESEVRRAIEIYIRGAYADAAPSTTVRGVLDAINTADGTLFELPAFVKSQDRYLVRLGNRFYQHMKLVIEPAPDGQSWLFKPDTHDRHLCPPVGHPEYAAFIALREKNQRVASDIEREWEVAGIPTFKRYLRKDLERRRAEQSAGGRT